MCCDMYCGLHWCYVLNTHQHLFNTNRYVFNTHQSVLSIYWFRLCANTDPIPTTIYANDIVKVLACITISANTSNIYQHALACITVAFGMYEIMICAHIDQTHAFFQYLLTPTPIHSPIWSQYIQIQTNTSSNTDQYMHHYRPMHISSFNTCSSTCQYRNWYCQIRLPHPHSQHSQHPLLRVRGIWASQAVLVSVCRIHHIPLFVVRQFLSACEKPNFPGCSKIPECWFGEITLREVVDKSICSMQMPHKCGVR